MFLLVLRHEDKDLVKSASYSFGYGVISTLFRESITGVALKSITELTNLQDESSFTHCTRI